VRLAQRIQQATVAPGEIALFSLAQAGFCFKTPAGRTLWLDPYLTDCVEHAFGFKRMIPTLVAPAEVAADVCLFTHAHLDHLDLDALPAFIRSTTTHFIAAADCEAALRESGLSPDRYTIFRMGDHLSRDGFELQAVYCDHGEGTPDAVGAVLTVEGVRVYVAGDTAFTPEPILATLPLPVDLMIAPINGTFGNLDSRGACALAALVRPKVLVPCHYWMFLEQSGDPAGFLAEAAASLPGVTALVLAPGEELRCTAATGLVSCQTFDPEAEA
jgi:L-ascorbate 6-phosphate lactonase